MSYDNRELLINGEGRPLFDKAIELAFLQEDENGFRFTRVRGWKIIKGHGLALQWLGENLPAPGMTAAQAADLAWAWLRDPKPKDVAEPKQPGDADIQGSKGWRVWYPSDHSSDHSSDQDVPGADAIICIVTPEWILRGK